MERVKVSVVYHSGFGHTKKVAESVAEGARSNPNAEVLLIEVGEVGKYWDELDNSDAIIMGAPTYMGSLSGEFKKFMDESGLIRWREKRWEDKLAAGFTNAASRSGDKLNSLIQLAIFAAQHHMNWINLGLPPGHNASFTSEDILNRHSFWLGVGTQSDRDLGPELSPPPADLKTAEFLGRRVAEAALINKVGRKFLKEEGK